jgi:hypothetical protein
MISTTAATLTITLAVSGSGSLGLINSCPEDRLICKKCNAEKTIKAHLVPRVFCTQVQTGKSHAVLVTKNGNFKTSQSGIWDNEILCAKCDGVLGEYENYMYKVSSSIRSGGSDVPGKCKIVEGVDTANVLKFCAGILYKYSLTSKQNGQIQLDRYQDVLKDFIFVENAETPLELDAFVFRPLRYLQDDGVFAYRAPLPDRKYGVNIYRMMMGGLVFFIKLDRRVLPDESIQKIMIKNCEGMPYLTTPVIDLEEFEEPRSIFDKNQRLSDYLNKNP